MLVSKPTAGLHVEFCVLAITCGLLIRMVTTTDSFFVFMQAN